MSSKLISVIAGAGAGTGAAIARKFASNYPVVLLARKPESYQSLVEKINERGGQTLGISADVTDSKSLDDMIVNVKEAFGNDIGIAIMRGLDTFDMADHYGDAELIVGLHTSSSPLVKNIAFTKWCPPEDENKSFENAKAAIDLALERMGVVKIDLLQCTHTISIPFKI